MIDTHCHLFWDDYAADLPGVLDRARAAGVRAFIVPATSIDTARQALALARRHPDVHAAAGVHPHDAAGVESTLERDLEALLAEPGVVAVGEIGLDYHYDFCPRPEQHRALHLQLELARRRGLPVVIHNREADDDVLAICREHQDGALRGQFHCFSSSAAVAERVLELGFHISFTGNVTYRNSPLAAVAAMVPDDRLLLETDAPFMAPVPHRGKRNEPAYLALVAAHLAALRGQDAATLAANTTRNAVALFRLPAA
jgi:TatD DNase family protein